MFLLLEYAVASKISRSHFIFEKYETVQSFNLHFLQNIPLVQRFTSTSDWKDVWNIPGSHRVRAFSALPSHSK